jgi:hypothetical protein
MIDTTLSAGNWSAKPDQMALAKDGNPRLAVQTLRRTLFKYSFKTAQGIKDSFNMTISH